MPLDDIALPTGVKGLKKYTDKYNKSNGMLTNVLKGTPVHVRSSIRYNDLLKYFNLDNTEPIRNSSKIKWIYLKNNPYGIEALSFKGYDDPPEIIDFINQYVDYDKLYKGAMEKKVKVFYGALSWDLPLDKKNTLERFF